MDSEKDYFNKNYNIGWVDETLPPPDNRLILKHYECSLVVYGVILLILQFNPFFIHHSFPITRAILNLYYLCYIIIAPFIYFTLRPKSLYRSHNIEICNYIKRVILHLPKLRNITPEDIKTELAYYKPTYLEGQSLMLIFIKTFFGSLMIYWFTSNIFYFQKVSPQFETIRAAFASVYDFETIKAVIYKHREFLYNIVISALFTIDLSIFIIGYFTELSILKNKIRTVETSPFGVFVCLMCYLPFSNALTDFLGWNQKNSYNGVNQTLVWGLRFVGLIFITTYVLASCALFTKGSNLTNRGIVSRFPYNIVRHPAYISKSSYWILNTIPVLFVGNPDIKTFLTKAVLVFLSLFFWVMVYYFRALTEERHLVRDPDYREYMKKVKYRFIPWVI